MGRGDSSVKHASRNVTTRRGANPIEEALGKGLPLNEIYIQFAPNDVSQPNWRVPGDFQFKEALQYVTPADENSKGVVHRDDIGLPIDHAVAMRLLKPEFVGKFKVFNDWYEPKKNLIQPPEATCAGMTDAGKLISKTIDNGETIAVYCDYDVDGTTAGEVFRRGLALYGAKLYYGYADAQQGFGLTNDFVREAHKAGASVLVTLDCGSTQVDQVALAQSLGMKVIVVDHHNIAENPADFHLNPKLVEPASSDNTGAQLSWKLIAATQAQREDSGKSREEHFEENLQLAGMGALADMASVMNHENRAFFWVANEHVVPGVRALAKALDEDYTTPGAMVLTQAAMNLPKRTSNVLAADIGSLLAAASEEDAAPFVEKLLANYEAAKPQKKAMTEQSLAQTGELTFGANREKIFPLPEKLVSTAVLDDFPEYAGYTGPVANQVSSKSGKPAVIFAKKADGTYKFSARNNVKARGQLGDLIEDPAMQEACTMEKENESGDVVARPIVGGHAEVVSGSCYEENIGKVIEAFDAWAEKCEKKARGGFLPGAYDGPEAYLSERGVTADRFEKIEAEARKLGPFSSQKQSIYQEFTGLSDRVASNQELNISVDARLSELIPDPDNENWMIGQLTIDGSEITREVRFPANSEKKPPIGRKAEWVLRVGRGEPYYLRHFHRARKNTRSDNQGD